MMNTFNLFVTGDPIQDVWIDAVINENNRLTPVNTTIRNGGAANTLTNLTFLSVGSTVGIMSLWNQFRFHQLIRVNDFAGNEFHMWDYFGKPDQMYSRYNPFDKLSFMSRDTPCGLIISEYNKGMVNHQNHHRLPTGFNWQFIIVDSRYRTLRTDILDQFPVKICHATGTELDDDPNWAKTHFDYVIHTNGPTDVEVIPTNGSSTPLSIQVPSTIPIDTIGAGDTFTAAVGMYLAHFNGVPITSEALCEATRFGIHVCQEVIQKHYTSIPNTTLIEYLKEN